MITQTKQRMVEAAVAAHNNAYVPYSKFHVGAAVLAEDGTVTTGANVESASYGLTICAERVAAAATVAAGQRKLIAVAIASSGGMPPCGACRQFLAEFAPDIDVFLVDSDQMEKVRETTLLKLLPEPFRLASE